MGNKIYKTETISFSGHEELLELAKARAKADGRNLSNYIRRLIALDLEKSGRPGANLLREEPSSEKIQTAAQKCETEIRYKIRRPRKPQS